MNTITNSGIRTIGIALAALLSIALFVAVAPKAQAADLFGDFGYGDYYPDMGISDFGYGDYYPSISDFGYGDYYPSYSDFGYGDYYPTSGFSDFGGFSSGGWSMPFSMPSGGGNMQSQSQSQGQSQSQSSTNVNNNNNVNNISINVPQAQQTVQQYVCPVGTTGVYPNCIYPQPVTPTIDICPNLPGVQSTLPAGYVIQYGNCQYQTIYPTPAPQPYVTLSQVPYTGLELGPVGTAIYWGFLVLWCLMAAYLIAVKKVQNKVVAWFTPSATPSHTVHAVHAPVAHAPVAKTAAPVSGIDSFIQSQINRTN